MEKLLKEVKHELEAHILPFWMRLKDEENGGYYGLVTYDLAIDQKAGKGAIATARQLWTFSAAYRVLKKEEYLECAHHAYRFLIDKVLDHEKDGLYWMVDYKGNPLDTRKHIYVQSFGIYALSEYYRVTKNEEALQYALNLFQIVETVGYDQKVEAYKEEFTRDWIEQENEMLSEHNLIADITTNTHLHILEAYTNLYRVWKNENLKDRILHLLDLFYNKIFDHETKFMKIFFNEKWESIIDVQSYGHDIEASWLIDDALKVLELDNKNYIQMVIDMAYNIAEKAVLEDGAIANECVNGKVDQSRVWWGQAEGMVGFLNAYERTKDPKFITLTERLWEYIKENIIDQREGGEWYWSVDEKNRPEKNEIAGPWKAPYHNSRFCLEFIERLGER